MRNLKIVLLVAIVGWVAIAMMLTISAKEGLLSEDLRLSIIDVVDVLGVSALLSSKSNFPQTAQLYYAFCIYLPPLFLVLALLRLWAPPTASYAVRLHGLLRIRFLIVNERYQVSLVARNEGIEYSDGHDVYRFNVTLRSL